MSRARAKGTSQETRLVRWLRQRGFDADRQPLRGCDDQEDVRIRCGSLADVLLQVKWRADVRRWSISSWAEALEDDACSDDLRLLVLPVPGRQLDAAVVVAGPLLSRAMLSCPAHWLVGAARTARSLVAELDRAAELVASLPAELAEHQGTPTVVYRGLLAASRLPWMLEACAEPTLAKTR